MSVLTLIPTRTLSEIQPAVMADLAKHAIAAQGAPAKNTERALRLDIRVFTAWCAEVGHGPLPVSVDTVAAFIAARAR